MQEQNRLLATSPQSIFGLLGDAFKVAVGTFKYVWWVALLYIAISAGQDFLQGVSKELEPSLLLMIGMVIIFITMALVTVYLAGVLIIRVYHYAKGDAASAAKAFSMSLAKLGWFVLFVLVFMLFAFIAMLPGLIIYVLAPVQLTMIILGVIYGIAFTIAGVYLLMAHPLIFLTEVRGPISAMKQSYNLVKGNWWRVFFYFFLLIGLIIAVMFIVVVPLGYMGLLLLSIIALFTIELLLVCLSNSAMVTLYNDLLLRK